MLNRPKFKVLTFLLTLASSLVFLAVFVGSAFVESRQVIEQQADGYNRALAARYQQRLNEYFDLVEEESHAISASAERIEALHAGDLQEFNASLARWEEGYENIHYDFVAVEVFEQGCHLSRSYVPELSVLPCDELLNGDADFASHGWHLVKTRGEWLAVYSEPLDLKGSGKIIGQLLVGMRLKGNRYLLNQLLMPADGLEMLGLFSESEPLAVLEQVHESAAPFRHAVVTYAEGTSPLGSSIRVGLISTDIAQLQLRRVLIETLIYGCLLALAISLAMALLLSWAVDRQLQQLITLTRLANQKRDTHWPQTWISEFNQIGAEVVSIVNCLKAREDELEGLNLQLSRNNQEKRQILQHLIQAQERERLRLSNELHDDMAQLLVAVKMHLQLHREELQQGNGSLDNLSQAEALVNNIYDTVYNRIRMLRPFELNDFGLGVSLTSLPAVKLLEQLDYAVEFDIAQTRPLQKELMSNLYRIAQEALSNVIKHAGGTYVLIKLIDEPQGLRMMIEDDGGGLGDAASTSSGGFGLLGIKERAEHMHAELTISSLEGVRIELFIPAEYAYADLQTGRTLMSE